MDVKQKGAEFWTCPQLHGGAAAALGPLSSTGTHGPQGCRQRVLRASVQENMGFGARTCSVSSQTRRDWHEGVPGTLGLSEIQIFNSWHYMSAGGTAAAEDT